MSNWNGHPGRMHGRVWVGIGSRLRYDDRKWTIVGLEGPHLLCRRPDTLLRLDVNDALAHGEILTADNEDPDSSTPTFAPFDVAPGAAQTSAARKLRLVNLLLFGSSTGLPGEISGDDARFGPRSGKPLSDRIAALAQEEDVGRTTLYRALHDYREMGASGLVDERDLRVEPPLGRCPREAAEIIWRVLSNQQGDSKHTTAYLTRKVNELGHKKYGHRFPDVSRKAMQGYRHKFDREFTPHLSKKTQLSRMRRPAPPFRSLEVSRPFEVVEIDSTELDVFTVSDVNGKESRQLWLTVALDVFTRLVVAWRITTKDPKGVDLAHLLHDMVRPKLWRPEWGEAARWRYGIPESLLIHDSTDAPLAGVPFGVPSTISVDNGPIFVSTVARDTCVELGIDLYFARPLTPTDKPHVERFFRTVNDTFVQFLPGYTGSSVADRGDKPHLQATPRLFESQVRERFGKWSLADYSNTPHRGLPRAPGSNQFWTPNEKYDQAIAITGFYAVPRSRDLRIRLLPKEARRVTHTGIELNHLHYDSDDLEPYRYQDSSYAELGFRWPIRYDPRDLSKIYFFEPEPLNPVRGQWITVPCTIALGQQPFADIELEWVKARAVADGYVARNRSTQHILDRGLVDYLHRVSTDRPESEKEAKVASIGRERVRQAGQDAADLGADPAPSFSEDAPADQPPDARSSPDDPAASSPGAHTAAAPLAHDSPDQVDSTESAASPADPPEEGLPFGVSEPSAEEFFGATLTDDAGGSNDDDH